MENEAKNPIKEDVFRDVKAPDDLLEALSIDYFNLQKEKNINEK